MNSGKFDASDGLAAEGAKRVWVASVGRGQVTSVDPALPLVDPETESPLHAYRFQETREDFSHSRRRRALIGMYGAEGGVVNGGASTP